MIKTPYDIESMPELVRQLIDRIVMSHWSDDHYLIGEMLKNPDVDPTYDDYLAVRIAFERQDRESIMWLFTHPNISNVWSIVKPIDIWGKWTVLRKTGGIE